MASEQLTRDLSRHLDELMTAQQLKLEYVAAAAGVGVETVRRVRNGEVRRLWDRTADKLIAFIERTSEDSIELARNRPADLLIDLVERNPHGVYLIQDDRIVFSNAHVEKITGYTSAELSSRTYTRFLCPDSQRLERERRQLRRQGRPLTDRYEVGVIRKDGQSIRAETQIARLSLDGKKTALGTLREVT